jgi:hypothetical protein
MLNKLISEAEGAADNAAKWQNKSMSEASEKDQTLWNDLLKNGQKAQRLLFYMAHPTSRNTNIQNSMPDGMAKIGKSTI